MAPARYLACLIAAVAAAPSVQAAVLVETGSEAQAGKLMRREQQREGFAKTAIDTRKAEVNLPAKPADGAAAKEKSNVQKYKELITEIYQEHNKEKLNEIDDLLKKPEDKIFGESQKEDDSREAEEEDVEADHERTPSSYGRRRYVSPYYYTYYYVGYR